VFERAGAAQGDRIGAAAAQPPAPRALGGLAARRRRRGVVVRAGEALLELCLLSRLSRERRRGE
jgi:hypothetical protein